MNQEQPTTAIVEFDPIKRTIQEFRSKYEGRTFDVADPAGFAEAKAAAKEGRKALIELDKIRKRRKERALRVCQQVDAEGRELKAGIGAIFDPIFRLVDAEDERREQERQESERREARRVASIRERLERLDPAIPFGAAADEIADLLEGVRATTIDDSFEEFEDDAFMIRTAAVSRLSTALAKVQEQEAASAAAAEALAAERAENDRLRAAVAEQDRATAAPSAGELFARPENLRIAAFCRSCLRPIEPSAIGCVCGWSMIDPEPEGGRPPLLESLRDRLAAFDPKPEDAARIADIAAAAEVRDRIRAEPSFGTTPESWIPPKFCANHADQKDAFAPFDEIAERLRAQADARAYPLDVFDDRANDAVRICGIVYSGDFFRAMAEVKVGGWFRVVARDGSRVDCFRAAPADVQRIDDFLAEVLIPGCPTCGANLREIGRLQKELAERYRADRDASALAAEGATE